MKYIFQIIILFFSLSSFAAENEPKTYIIGVEDYVRYPFQAVYKGEYTGKFRQILDQFAKSEGIKFIYKPYKIPVIYDALFDNEIDFKFPDNAVWKSPEKTKYKIKYSNFLTHYIDGIFVKNENYNKELKNYKVIGIVDDVILWVLRKREEKGKIRFVKANSCAELITMLFNAEIDSVFCNYDVMKYLLEKSSKENELVFDSSLPYIDNYFYVSTINHPEIIDKLNLWISKNRENIEKLVHEY